MAHYFYAALLLLFFCGTQSSRAQATDSTAQQPKNAAVAVLGFADDGATLHPLKLSSITEKEYLSFDSTYTKLAKQPVKETDSHFFLNIMNGEVPFEKGIAPENRLGGESWYEYIGYYPDIKLYALRSVSVTDEMLTFADLVLIDPNSGYEYVLLPVGDYFDEPPLLSPNNRYLLQYYNSFIGGSRGTYFRVFKLHDKSKPETYMVRHADPETYYPFYVEKVVWISDSEFAVKAYSIPKPGKPSHAKRFEYYKLSVSS